MTVGLVSTSHMLEATRKAVLGISLDENYHYQKQYEEEYFKEHRVIREAMEQLEEDYQVTIPDGEISYLVSLFVTYPAI